MSATRPAASRKNWFARHEIGISIVGLLLVIPLVTQCSAQDGGTAASEPPTMSSAEAPVPRSTPTASTATPTANVSKSAMDRASAAKKSALAKKQEAAAKKAAAAKEAAAERAAAKKRAAAKQAAAKKAAAKKAAAERAAAKKAAEKRAAAKRAAQQREDARDTFANCADMNQVYPHGVGRPGARDHSSGPPVTNFKVSQHIYDLNSSSDKDGDGIACEKL